MSVSVTARTLMSDRRGAAKASVLSLRGYVAESTACRFFPVKIAPLQFASCKSEIVLPKLDTVVIMASVFVSRRYVVLSIPSLMHCN